MSSTVKQQLIFSLNVSRSRKQVISSPVRNFLLGKHAKNARSLGKPENFRARSLRGKCAEFARKMGGRGRKRNSGHSSFPSRGRGSEIILYRALRQFSQQFPRDFPTNSTTKRSHSERFPHALFGIKLQHLRDRHNPYNHHECNTQIVKCIKII